MKNRNQFFDYICDLHKDNDWGGKKEEGKLLDWRNNEDDKESLSWYLGRLISFEKEPCRICGDPRHICTQNPQVDHYDLVFEDGQIIGESERLVEDDNGNVIEKGGLYDKDTLSKQNTTQYETQLDKEQI